MEECTFAPKVNTNKKKKDIFEQFNSAVSPTVEAENKIQLPGKSVGWSKHNNYMS